MSTVRLKFCEVSQNPYKNVHPTLFVPFFFNYLKLLRILSKIFFSLVFEHNENKNRSRNCEPLLKSQNSGGG